MQHTHPLSECFKVDHGGGDTCCLPKHRQGAQIPHFLKLDMRLLGRDQTFVVRVPSICVSIAGNLGSC